MTPCRVQYSHEKKKLSLLLGTRGHFFRLAYITPSNDNNSAPSLCVDYCSEKMIRPVLIMNTVSNVSAGPAAKMAALGMESRQCVPAEQSWVHGALCSEIYCASGGTGPTQRGQRPICSLL